MTLFLLITMTIFLNCSAQIFSGKFYRIEVHHRLRGAGIQSLLRAASPAPLNGYRCLDVWMRIIIFKCKILIGKSKNIPYRWINTHGRQGTKIP